MPRSPQEVFQHHAEALGAGDLDAIVDDYSDDAVLITPDGVMRGKDGIREAFTQLLADLPNAGWELKTQIYEGDVLFLEWTADAAKTRVEEFIVESGPRQIEQRFEIGCGVVNRSRSGRDSVAVDYLDACQTLDRCNNVLAMNRVCLVSGGGSTE